MQHAVHIENLNFSYGLNRVLCNFCARVEYSQIYALLGPSGGGKTTLLKLILGRLKIQSGSIRVLDLPPGAANSAISFMPQESGLCKNFTINQTLRYFKLVYQISNEEFYIRRRTLTKLVNLPSGNLLVSQLSGGTQRRLSLVVSLINNPSVVILDEPTVGIDALLRAHIWDYLVSRSTEGMTVIIVTHYIEEAANAGRVGLMRNGRLLAEDNPQKLMSQYKEPNLEAVFLNLCCIEDKGEYLNANSLADNQSDKSYLPATVRDNELDQDGNNNNNNIFHISTNIPNFETGSYSTSIVSDHNLWSAKLWILFSLIYRNILKFIYSYFSIIMILLPATQALIFCLAVGKETIHLKAAVFNQENETAYGSQFIEQIKPHRNYQIEPRMCHSLDEAMQAVIQRQVTGAIWIPANYSDALDQRIEDAFAADNDTVHHSTIRLYLDNSVYLYGIEFVNVLLEAFTNFARKVFREKDMNTVEIPFNIETTSASRNYQFKDYYLPAYLLLFMYISQITVASLTLTQERKDGLFERSIIAGVSHELVLCSHIITGLLIAIIQLTLLNLTTFLFYDNPYSNGFWLQFVFFATECLNAMSLGYFISSLIDNELACLIMVWFITIPQILSSGVFWPLESLHKPLNVLFYLWPLSVPVQTIRQIMLQGYGLSNAHVQYGFLSSVIPTLLFFYSALLIFKHK